MISTTSKSPYAVAVLAVLVATFAAALLASPAAHASGCTDSWTNTAGGSWFTGTNWSSGSPPEAEAEACIVAAGTYTVTLSEPGATLGLRSLTIGGGAGRQTLAVAANTSLAGATALEPSGQIAVAAGIQLTVGAGDTLSNDGAIEAAGSGAVVIQGEPLTPATFTEGTGSIDGSRPVVVDDGTLAYTGSKTEHGSGPITLRGRGTVTGDVRQEQALTIESVCGQETEVVAEGTERSNEDFYFLNGGRLELTSDSCARNIFLRFGGWFENYGTFVVDNPYVAFFQISSCIELVNYGTIQLDATPRENERRMGPSLSLPGENCFFWQKPSGTLRTFVASATDFGRLSAPRGGRIEGGTLDVRPVAPFVGSVGESFRILTFGTSGPELGFATETEHPVTYAGQYYRLRYENGRVELDVTQATETRAPTKGPPGTLVAVGGAGYGEAGHLSEVTLTFTDHEGVKTIYPNVFLNGTKELKSGELSTQIEVPATAALGMGKITVTSPQSDVHVSKSFNVT